MAFTLLTCAVLMAAVGVISYFLTRGTVESKNGYFLAGRGLSSTFIAGSLLLTNLSAEQLIGLNGSAYGFNLSAMAWEVTAVVAIIVMALFFLPRYLRHGYSTLTEYLRARFDDGTRRVVVVLFLLGYTLITLPAVLYTGSIAVLSLFDLPAVFGVSEMQALVGTILVIGVVGAAYAIFGGLRAVAVSATINGIGLLIIGVWVPVLALGKLGGGDFLRGISILTSEHTQKLNAVGSSTDPTPFVTVFTGMICANLFYWGTNQFVIQRALGAKSLEAGQKGVLATGAFKLLMPFLMMIPGVVAFHLYGPGLKSIDMAYPRLVADLMPPAMMGLFLATLLSAVFDTYDSVVNSAATLFCLDVYAPMRKQQVSDHELIRVAKWVSVVVSLISFCIAPLLKLAPDGIWQVIRIFNGFYNVPIIAIVLVGLLVPRVPALGAKVVIVFHVVTYGLLNFVWKPNLNFVHLFGILFLVEVAIMLATAWRSPRRVPVAVEPPAPVDMRPWRYAWLASALLVSGIVGMYVLFSPLGLVGGDRQTMLALLAATPVVCVGLAALARRLLRRSPGPAMAEPAVPLAGSQ